MAVYKCWRDAIVRVLGDADKALTIEDIDVAISEKEYYSSKAKGPKGRKDTINGTLNRGDKEDLFVQLKSSTELDKYELSNDGKIYYRTKISLSPVTDGDVSKSSVDMKSSSESEISQEIKIGNLNVVDALKSNHNIILHGAPGTGKTYLAREIAKAMCGVDDIKKLEKSGQFKMVQFHPSYDYTDFVEGLRPTDKNEKGEVVKDIHFVRTDGIFKAFCRKAVISMDNLEAVSPQSIEDSVATEEFDINKCWGLLIQDILSDKVTTFKLKEGLYTTPIDIQTQKSRNNDKIIYFTKLDGSSKGNTVRFANIHKLSQTFQNKESLNSIQTLQPVKKAIGVGCDHSKCWAVLNYIYENYKCNNKIDTTDNFTTITPFIFLIDEINRGDMSKIFGELFFSIDPGYRANIADKDSIKVVDTQYQNLIPKEGDKNFEEKDADPFRKGFYIPDNVYIIGTMNDIDRSVESMDFAMRRRFQFIEVKPEHRADDMGVKKDSEARKRMTSLNNCISGKVEDDGIGLSAAYHIGPSYFMRLAKGEESVIDLWNYRLEGLLREYLRGYDDADSKIEKLKKAFNDTSVKTQKTDSTQQHEGAESAENGNEENA